eukprot:gene38372-63723_t
MHRRVLLRRAAAAADDAVSKIAAALLPLRSDIDGGKGGSC